MRAYQDIYIKCSKDALVTILNRAFLDMGSENRLAVEVVEADDSIEVINQKIEKAKDYLAFTLLDFLDDRNRMDSPYKDRVQSFIENPDPNDEVVYCVSLHGVKESDAEYTLHIGSSDDDDYQASYDYDDWQDWCERMVRLYGCRVVFYEETVDGWHTERFFDPDGSEVKQTKGGELEIDSFQYWERLNRLKEETGMSLSSQLELAIHDYESLGDHLKWEIRQLEIKLENAKKAESGIQEDEPHKEISDEELPF